jgi:dolichyl-phosphooligosaccharide-protein glycotransferase
LIPPIVLLSSFFIWLIIDKIDYTAMIKSVKRVGGLQGIRKGVSFLHVFGILFIAFLLILPNAYLALDAAVPATEKNDVFGDLPSGAFGSSFGKEQYWVDAYEWLATQDTEISDPKERPAFISWWDYGFYGVAVGGHPMVADNFQDGIPPASNFHTSTSEQEAVSVWIIRLLEGEAREGPISTTIVTTLKDYLNETDANNFVSWVEEPTSSPSYGEPIAPEYGEEFSQDYPVGQQWPENAVYHDGMDLLTSELSDEELTMLYRDIQDLTGNSIRYYGVEGYDRQIFNIFGFLADRSLLLVAGEGEYSPEDEFTHVKYVTQNGEEINFEEVMNRTDIQNQQDPIVDTKTIYKDPYFETMFYKTYVGIVETDENGQKTTPQYQIPCQDMKHFYAQYISPYPEYAYNQGQSAVVIAKYYEGAIINGSISFLDEPKDFDVVVQQNISHYGTEIPVAHDTNTSVNGSYEVIVPAGEVTLQVQRYPELGQNAFVMLNVTFGEKGMHSAITEDEATRSTDDYQRQVDIEIPTASMEGYVYDNMDDSEGVFNESSDTPLVDTTIQLYGIDALDPNQGTPTAYDWNNVNELTTDENGHYNVSSLLPGYYQIVVIDKDGFQLENNIIPVNVGDNWHNVTRPQEGNIEGKVYFDENDNDAYDAGEEITGASIDVVYTSTGTNKVVETITTDANGDYETSSFLPGSYELNVTKLPEYETLTSVTIEENKTTMENVSIEYAKILVSGETLREDTNQPISNINISFAADISVENNTANDSEAQSGADGSYSLELMPGSYTVDVAERVNESGTMVQYTFTGTLTISVGQDPVIYDISMAREEE